MERMTPDTTDFNSLSKKQLVELVITKYNDCFRLEEENKKLREDYKVLGILNDEIRRVNENLRKENKKLKEGVDAGQKLVEDLISKNKKLKETIKDHQLYEEKLEHRIIEFEELLHGE